MKRIINYRPTLFSAASLVAAVFSSYLIFVKGLAVIGIIISAAIITLTVFVPITVCAIYKKDTLKTAIIFSVVSVLIAAVGFTRFYFTVSRYGKSDLGDVNVTVSGKVDTVENFSDRVGIVLSGVEFSGRLNGNNGYKIFVSVYGKVGFDVGDRISFSALVQDKPILYEGKFCAAEVERGIKYYASVNSSEVSVIGNFSDVFNKVNVAVRKVLSDNLGEDEFAVAYALILGNSEYSDSEILSSYRQAGVAHIFAVSGLHIGFLAAVLSFILKKNKLNPYISAVIIFVILIFYSGVCGFSASSLRASIMCGISLFISSAGGRYDGLSSVSIAAIIILLISPVQLFCAGFLLSFSVVLGIMLGSKSIGRAFNFLPEKFSLTVGAVVSAWLFSAPILLIFFGNLSLFAVVSNLILLPVVGLIYVFIIICVALSFISPAVFMFLPKIVLSVINYAVNVIDYSPFIIGGIVLTFTTLFYYAALLTPSGIVNLSKLSKTVLTVIFAFTFAVTTFIYNVKDSSAVKAYVLGSYGICATVVEDGNARTVIVSVANKNFPVSRLNRLYGRNGEKETNVVITYGGDVNMIVTRLLALSEINAVYYYESDPNTADFYENVFKTVDFYVVAGRVLSISDYTVEYKEGGRAVEINSGKTSALVFSEFGDGYANFSENAKNYDLIVAFDYLERIAATYNCSEFLSYRNSTVYSDAERSGNYLFKFV